jgi:hypothetical protein
MSLHSFGLRLLNRIQSIQNVVAENMRFAIFIIRSHWFEFVTLIILAFAGAILLFTKNLEQASQIGELISGFAAALAFLWLIASFQFQSREIASQREELKIAANSP